jgi:hypothetical protein
LFLRQLGRTGRSTRGEQRDGEAGGEDGTEAAMEKGRGIAI